MAEEDLDGAVGAITRRVTAADLSELETVLHDALAEVGPILGVERAYVIAVDSSRGSVVLADEWYEEGSEAALSTVLAMGPRAREEEIRRRLASLGVNSVVMVPARAAGSLTGTFFVATSVRTYLPSMNVMAALQSIVDAFVNRLVGIRADQARLAMRDELGSAKPELPPP